MGIAMRAGKGRMGIWIVFIIYVLMSATGLYMIKTGTADAGIGIRNGLFSLQVPVRLFLGFLIYVCSFLLSVYLVSRMNLSVFYPAGTGAILVLACLYGHFLLKERIGTPQLLGIALILIGVVCINMKK